MTTSKTIPVQVLLILLISYYGRAMLLHDQSGRWFKVPATVFGQEPVDVISPRECTIVSSSPSLATTTCRRTFFTSTANAFLGPSLAVAATGTTGTTGSDIVSPTSSQQPYRVSLQVALDATQTGEIVIQVEPGWAPLAAQRFEELLQDDFFTDAKFFRVLPGYVAQFGIAGNPELNKKWMFDKSKALPDEARLQSNKKGTLSFASSGPNSRQTQIFINLANNDGPPNFLDAQGFVPFARIVQGMDDVVPKLYSGYGLLETSTMGMAGSVNQGKAAYYGNEYLEALFPKLSTIQNVQRLS